MPGYEHALGARYAWGPTFGTRGSQVQILPLRPTKSRLNNTLCRFVVSLFGLTGQILGQLFPVRVCFRACRCCRYSAQAASAPWPTALQGRERTVRVAHHLGSAIRCSSANAGSRTLPCLSGIANRWRLASAEAPVRGCLSAEVSAVAGQRA
jgi:hypothetical protein